MKRRALVLGAMVALAGVALASDAAPGRGTAWPRVLRVCADPNNLPFSDSAGRGFENRLAQLIAADLGAEVRYTWWAQRRGFVRNTLRAGACDLIPGVPTRFEPVATTAPYYRSTYVFLSRADLEPAIESFDDPRLRKLRVGVHLIGDDYANPPPVSALARRGIVRNVAGYSIYGDYRQPNPPARLVEAVARDDVDVAVVWGPLGGYFASRSDVPLRVTPIAQPDDGPGVPFEFSIAMGVRREDAELARTVEDVLARRRGEVRRILEQYGVPLVGRSPAPRPATPAVGRSPAPRPSTPAVGRSPTPPHPSQAVGRPAPSSLHLQPIPLQSDRPTARPPGWKGEERGTARLPEVEGEGAADP